MSFFLVVERYGIKDWSCFFVYFFSFSVILRNGSGTDFFSHSAGFVDLNEESKENWIWNIEFRYGYRFQIPQRAWNA